jgi:hypothetical protein
VLTYIGPPIQICPNGHINKHIGAATDALTVVEFCGRRRCSDGVEEVEGTGVADSVSRGRDGGEGIPHCRRQRMEVVLHEQGGCYP